MIFDLDDLFDDGVELGDDFVVKAQLKIKASPPVVRVERELVDRVCKAYADRLVMLCADIERVLRRVDARKSLGLYVLPGGLSGDTLVKAWISDALLHKASNQGAAKQPAKPTVPAKGPTLNASGQQRSTKASPRGGDYQRPVGGVRTPGVRGGKWYRDDHGNVRYGTKPTGDFQHELTDAETAEHLEHYVPNPLMLRRDVDLVEHFFSPEGKKIYSFSEDERSLLDWWYGEADPKTGERTEGALDVFMEQFPELQKQELDQGDVSKIKLRHPELTGGKPMSFQETLVNFMAHQDWGTDDDGEPLDFHEGVKPVIDSLFKRFDEARQHPAAAAHIADVGRQIEAHEFDKIPLFAKQLAYEDEIKKFGDDIVSEPDPSKMATEGVAMLSAMDLLFVPKAGQTNKAAHLRGCVSPNVSYFGKKSPLLQHPDKLKQMTTSGLMGLWIGSALFDMWDDETRTYVHGAGVGNSKVGELILDAMKQKLGVDSNALAVIRDQMEASTQEIAKHLSDGNTGKNPVLKEFVKRADEIVKDPKKADEIRKQMRELMQRKAEALEAQQDENFALPKSMADGVLGAEHQAQPLPHQILDKTSGRTFSLFRHQRQSLNWMATAKRGLLALDAGMGKTPTVITFMEHMKEQGKAKTALLFLPPSLMAQWPKEIQKYAPNVKSDKILNLAGMSLEQRKQMLQSDMAKNAEYIIISTGTLNGGGEPEDGESVDESGQPVSEAGMINDGTGGTDDELKEILKGIDGAVFIDEVHQGGFKTDSTVRHQIAKDVMADRDYAFGMTATPMPNHPIDLYHLTNLFAPGTVGDQEEWEGSLHGVQWNDSSQRWDVTNPENLKELRERIRPFVMHKLITDKDVVEDMGKQLGTLYEDPDLQPIQPPDDHPIHEYLRPGGKIAQLVEARLDVLEKERGVDFTPDERQARGAAIANVMTRMACISPELFDPSYKGGAPKVERLVSDVVKHFKGGGGAEDKPVVVFSSLPRKAFPVLKRELVRQGVDPSLIGEIHGGKSSKERAFEQDMTNDGKRKILLVGTLSGGAGLNLQKKSNRMQFLDQPWHPAAKRQGIGRVWRTGQKNPVMMSNYTLSSSYGATWDERINDKVASKQAMTTAMMTDVDLDSIDFTHRAEEALETLMGQQTAEKKGKRGQSLKETRQKYSPEIAALAAKLNFTGEGGDGEDTEDSELEGGGKTIDYTQFFDPKKHKELTAQARGLAHKMDVPEEERVWNRAYDIENVTTEWKKIEALAQSAKATGDEKAQNLTSKQAKRLVNKCKTWYAELLNEAKGAKEAGDHERSKGLLKLADRLSADMPQAFRGGGDDAEDEAFEKLAEDGSVGAKSSGRKAASKPIPAAKPLKGFSIAEKSPFKVGPERDAWKLLQKHKPKTLDEAKKLLKPHLKEAYGTTSKEDLNGFIKYLREHGAIGV